MYVQCSPGNHSRRKRACAFQFVDAASDVDHSLDSINVQSTGFDVAFAVLSVIGVSIETLVAWSRRKVSLQLRPRRPRNSGSRPRTPGSSSRFFASPETPSRPSEDLKSEIPSGPAVLHLETPFVSRRGTVPGLPGQGATKKRQMGWCPC